MKHRRAISIVLLTTFVLLGSGEVCVPCLLAGWIHHHLYHGGEQPGACDHDGARDHDHGACCKDGGCCKDWRQTCENDEHAVPIVFAAETEQSWRWSTLLDVRGNIPACALISPDGLSSDGVEPPGISSGGGVPRETLPPPLAVPHFLRHCLLLI
jgi:hypothetical protein